MNMKQFKELISTADYKALDLTKFRYNSEIERRNQLGQDQYLFENLEAQLGRLPTEYEFCKSHDDSIRAYLNSRANTTGIQYNREISEAIVQRFGRMYRSQLVEYSTVLRIKELFPHMAVGVNKYLDNTAGIDIAVSDPETNKTTYIHIISDTQGAWSRLEEKWYKKGTMRLNNREFKFKRNPNKRNHVVMAYTKYPSESTEIINGLPVLKEEYVRKTVLQGLEKSEETWALATELSVFHNWLIENGVEEGLYGMAQ